jgi:hypothetical protein
MAFDWRRYILHPISDMFEGADVFLTNLRMRNLKKQLLGTATDKFIEGLLMGMGLYFSLSRSYRKHINNFEGRYFFRSADENETIAASAIFENANMRVGFEAIDDWDVMVTFKNGKALRDYLFSEKQDIFESISENAVEVDGNLNHIFKFGFMVQDLTRRLGIE